MRIRRPRKVVSTPAPGWLCAVLAVSLFAPGCGGEKLVSSWRDREVTIDGVIGGGAGEAYEWAGARTAIKDTNVSVGLMNDDEYLYISLASADRRLVGQMMVVGFTVWFDPDGGKDKVLGVQFPLGAQLQGMGPGSMGPMAGRGQGGWDEEESRSRFQEAIESMDELVILGPGKDERHPRVMGEAYGIEVGIGMSGGTAVYELRMPLVESEAHRYAIGAHPGDRIGVRLETGQFDFGAMRGGRPSGPRGGVGGEPPGGMGGRGGGMGGGRMGGGRRGGHPSPPEPLDLYAKVELASADAEAAEGQEHDVAVITVED